jgi:hypothetical protein
LKGGSLKGITIVASTVLLTGCNGVIYAGRYPRHLARGMGHSYFTKNGMERCNYPQLLHAREIL